MPIVAQENPDHFLTEKETIELMQGALKKGIAHEASLWIVSLTRRSKKNANTENKKHFKQKHIDYTRLLLPQYFKRNVQDNKNGYQYEA